MAKETPQNDKRAYQKVFFPQKDKIQLNERKHQIKEKTSAKPIANLQAPLVANRAVESLVELPKKHDSFAAVSVKCAGGAIVWELHDVPTKGGG